MILPLLHLHLHQMLGIEDIIATSHTTLSAVLNVTFPPDILITNTVSNSIVDVTQGHQGDGKVRIWEKVEPSYRLFLVAKEH